MFCFIQDLPIGVIYKLMGNSKNTIKINYAILRVK